MEQHTGQPKNLSAFLEWERGQNQRYEFLAATPRELCRESECHGQVLNNLSELLRQAIHADTCEIYRRSYKVIAKVIALIPDLVITETNTQFPEPVFIAEVVSPTSAAEDRGERWAAYQTLPSLAMYMLVEQQHPRVEVFHRGRSGWRYQSFDTAEAVLPLWVPNFELPMREIYAGVERSPT